MKAIKKSVVRKPLACPSMEEVRNAIKILSDQWTHYLLLLYQVLYDNNLTNPSGFPLKITRVSSVLGPTVRLKASYVKHEETKSLYFYIWGDESDEKILEKAKMLINGVSMEKPDRRACCVYAKKVFCVCEASFECPLHGTMCIGSHD